MRVKIQIVEQEYSPELIDAFYFVAKHIPIPPSALYIPKENFEQSEVFSNLRRLFPSAMITFIASHLKAIAALVPPKYSDYHGYEIWIGRSNEDSESVGYLHVDNDECLRKRCNIVKCPILGTILYLGPRSSMKGGGTLFLANKGVGSPVPFVRHDPLRLVEIDGAEVVLPAPGRIVVFDGEMLHAVMPFSLDNKINPRINLLVNIWKDPIECVPSELTNSHH